jgi:putative ABC transport system permease protein
MAKSIPRIGEVGLDWRLFLYTAVCSILVTLLAGLFPALQASGASPAEALSRGGRTQVSASRPAQWALVSIQIALAVCLLCGAGLLLRSFAALSQVSPGFDAAHVLVFRLTGTYAETADLKKVRQGVTATLAALRELPGVQASAASLFLPGVPRDYPVQVTSPDAGFDPTRAVTAEARYVSQGYFPTMHIPLLAGTFCDTHSDGASVMVNRSFVTTYFDRTNPLGYHLANSTIPGDRPLTILGVVGDAREGGINHEPAPTVYWCGLPVDPGRYYLLRTAGDPANLVTAVEQRIHSVEPARAIYDLAPLPEHLSDAFSEVRLRTVLLTLFAATAMSLACIGLYGAMTYFVTSRRREVGLRMALGARRAQIGLRFVGRGLAVTAIGVVTGLCLAASSARFLSGLLFNMPSNDAWTFSIAVIAMLSVALVASAVPAIRATRVDPMQSLREE